MSPCFGRGFFMASINSCGETHLRLQLGLMEIGVKHKIVGK